MNLYNYLLEGRQEGQTALWTLQGKYTYAELRQSAREISALLVHQRCKQGERALLIADSGFFWVAAYLGILHAGLVCVPLSPKTNGAELAWVLQTAEPVVAFVQTRYRAQLNLAGSTMMVICDQNRAVSESNALDLAMLRGFSLPLESPPCPVATEDLAALMFTSGSTGKPRGVMVSHGNIIANTHSIITYLTLGSADRIMAVLPFHYCFGASLLHTHLAVGGCVVVDPHFLYPDKVLQRMSETECTGFAGVPSHFQILLRRSQLAKTSLPHLRYVQQAGGQLAPAFITELRQALPGKQIFIMYGQTEATARLSYLPPEMLPEKIGSVGKGIPGVKLSVLTETGHPVTPGDTGEIVAEGQNVATGYWRDPEETQRCFRDGKLYTGDLATIDPEGFIYIVDRAKEFLKCGGQRVSCRSLENVLLEYPALLEAAVVAIPDQILGEAPVAFVVPRDPRHPPTSRQISDFCRQRLPLPLVPRHFVIIEAIPKNSSGKPLKPALKERAAALLPE